jgi:hypothetical protein
MNFNWESKTLGSEANEGSVFKTATPFLSKA